MNPIELKVIILMFSERFFKRGMEYFHERNVIGLCYNRLDEAWFAEVNGTKIYYVEIQGEDLLEKKIDSYCDCPAYAMYSTCKHVVAVLLEISHRGLFVKESDKDFVTERFIEQIIQNKQRESLDII